MTTLPSRSNNNSPRPASDDAAIDTTQTWLVSLTFALIYCGYPLISFVGAVDSRTPAIAYRVALLLLLAVIIARSKASGRRWNTAWFPLCGFWTLYAARIIYDYFILQVDAPRPPLDHIAFSIGSAATVAGLLLVREPRQFRFAPVIVVTICTSVALLAYSVGVVASYDSLGRLMISDRLNPIILGHTATTLLLTILWFVGRPSSAFDTSSSLHRRFRAIGVWLVAPMLGLIGLGTLGLAASRSPVVALGIGTAIFVLFAGRRALLAPLIAVVVVFGATELGFQNKLQDFGVPIQRLELNNLLALDDQNTGGGRSDLFQEAWESFLESPIFGKELFLPDVVYPHNTILEALMATGVFGGLFLIWMLTQAGIGLARASRRSPESLWLLLLFAQAVTAAMSSGAIFYDPMLWGSLGVGLGLYHLRRESSAASGTRRLLIGEDRALQPDGPKVGAL